MINGCTWTHTALETNCSFISLRRAVKSQFEFSLFLHLLSTTCEWKPFDWGDLGSALGVCEEDTIWLTIRVNLGHLVWIWPRVCSGNQKSPGSLPDCRLHRVLRVPPKSPVPLFYTCTCRFNELNSVCKVAPRCLSEVEPSLFFSSVLIWDPH